MRTTRISRKMPVGLLFVSLSLFVLAGCGSPAKATATTTKTLSATSATSTACASATRTASSFNTAIGTLESINGQTLVLTTTQGSSVTATYSSSTRFTQEITIPATSLQEGTAVRAAVTSDGDTYDATTITVTTGTTGFTRNGTPATGTPGAGAGGQFRNNPCFSRGQGQTGTPRTGSGTNGNGASTFRGLTGTVSELSGNVLTIADSTGTSYTVNITAQTQIVETNSVKATALKVGEPLTVTGAKGSQGTIAANTIAILLSLPTRTPTATPAP